MNKKLGKPTSQRMAMLKNQASDLLWLERIETTEARGKEVARYAEKLITLAIKTKDDTIEVKKTKTKVVAGDKKGSTKKVKETIETLNDGPKKLAARRKIMSKLVDIQEKIREGESMDDYKLRTKDVAHPLIEKIFNDLAKRYEQRAKDKGTGGGYTRIIKTGFRRGDNADMCIVELIKN